MTKEEAIKRLIDDCCKYRLYCELYPDACMKEECEIYMAIRALQGRPKGKWILTQDEQYEYCTCSECGYQNGENWMNGSDIPFCAMCGADMRGADDDIRINR